MSRGFTLIELIFVVAVAALVMGIAVPSFQAAVKNSAMTSSTNNMIASLQLARSEALKRRAPVTICASLDADACADEPWNAGWIVFADDNGDATHQATEDLIHVEAAMPRRLSVTLPANQPLQNSLTYLPTGFPNLGGLAAAGAMVLCDDRQSNAYGRIIVISQTGRPMASAADERSDLNLGARCE